MFDCAHMVADQYLQIRAQLGTALFSLSTLAHGLHAGREVLQSLHDLRQSLREPFLFLVAGEEKSGKSSLVNALFGREIIPAEAPPAGDKIHIYKYGAEEGETPVYEQFIEHYRPDALLRDFNIVDTPPSSTITHQHLAIVDQLLPEADLVLFVFSVTNPWSSSSREFLAHIGDRPPRKAVFVLQQCDLRDALEVDAVAKHLEQIIHEKFPEECRVFPVSAKLALLSKTAAADKEGLFQQSNFGALESYIDDIAAGNGERTAVLRAACRRALGILEELAEKTRGAFVILKRDIEVLAELDFDIEERRSQAARLAGGVQWTVAQTYERMQKRGEEILQQKGLFKRGSREEKLQPPIDAKFEESILRQIQHSMELLEGDLLLVWPQFHETIRRMFPDQDPAAEPADLINERTQLLQQIELSIWGKKSPEYFGQQASRLFAGMAEWLGISAETLNDEGFRALVPALARLAITDFYQALAAVTATQGKFAGLGKGGKILAQFRAEMGVKREALLATLEGHLRHATDLFHREPHAALQPLQSFCSRQLMIYEPRIALAKQMEETLGKTAAALGLPARPPAPPQPE